MGTGIGATMFLLLGILGVVLAVVWIILPFAILGTKPLLRELVIAQHRTNELLEQAARERGAGARP